MSPATDGLTLIVDGAIPELAESISQGWSLAPVKVKDPAPVLVMLTLPGVKVDDPAWTLKLRLGGVTFRTGAAGFTVRVDNALRRGSN